MYQFNSLDEQEKWNACEFKTPLNSQAKRLWHGAKRNFYYRDNLSRAALLCKQIIAQTAWSEEADEAKLLLHDIRIDIRKLAGASGKETGLRRTIRQGVAEPVVQPATGPVTKIPIATAVVALPIIGIARDGIIGIAVPEIIALLVLGTVFWTASKIRIFLKSARLLRSQE